MCARSEPHFFVPSPEKVKTQSLAFCLQTVAMQHQPQQTASLSASLSEALHELLQSRPHAGREVADALLELLSPWELLYLRRRVSSFQLDGQAFASWPDLPQEIIVEIVAHLSLSDLLTSRLVSREWKKTWLSDYVINRYLKRSHPGVIESSPAGMPRENLLMRTILTYRRKAPNGLTGAFIPWFTRQAPQISTTRKGTPVFQLSLDLVYHHEQSGAPRPLYSGGKVAWHLPSFRFGVDDIRAAQRVIYTLSIDRRRSPPVIQMAAFTGKMLVVSSHSLNSTKL